MSILPIPTQLEGRLYLRDPYLSSFTSKVIERGVDDGTPYVVLEESAFYPTGGGQPFDKGTLNGICVTDVVVRGDGVVIHKLEEEILDDKVDGEVNWDRRTEHMCLHTGQHVLSQAIRQTLSIDTVSFHLGEESVTIDLATRDVSSADLDRAEVEANRIIREARPVKAWFPTPEEMESLSIRKLSDKAGDTVRLVEISDFDRCGCGGTHVRNTAEIQLIKILHTEVKNGQTRVHFTAGPRALRDYERKHEVVASLTSTFSLTQQEIIPTVQKLVDSGKRGQKELDHLKRSLAEYRGKELAAKAPLTTVRDREVRLVKEIMADASVDELRSLVHSIIATPHMLAILAKPGDPGTLVIGSSSEIPAKDLLQEILKELDTGRGGGNAHVAQGSLSLGENELKEFLNQHFI